MARQVETKKKAMLIPLDSYLYLQTEGYRQRCGKEHPNVARLERNFKQHSTNGYYTLMDGDLGGCIGNPENAYEEGRWTSWSCATMKEMLKDKGLTYKDTDDIECIEVYI